MNAGGPPRRPPSGDPLQAVPTRSMRCVLAEAAVDATASRTVPDAAALHFRVAGVLGRAARSVGCFSFSAILLVGGVGTLTATAAFTFWPAVLACFRGRIGDHCGRDRMHVRGCQRSRAPDGFATSAGMSRLGLARLPPSRTRGVRVEPARAHILQKDA